MPTADRRRFVPLALRTFLAQDYPHRELIVVDDGSDPIEDLLPEDDRIRYLRLEARESIGAKRNRACQMARGSLVAHWDDDDWCASRRLRRQVEALRHSGRAACGLDRVYFCDPEKGRAWQYRYPRGGNAWVAGGTLMYRRNLWASHRFEDVSNGEDTRFVWDLAATKIHVQADPKLYVARIHERNTSSKCIHTARWHREPVAFIREVMGEDWLLFTGRGGGGCGIKKRSTASSQVQVGFSDSGGERPRSGRESEPRVTVTIPYYECKPHVRRAVTSVLEQTYRHLRLVVVNDGDPDPPWDVLEDIDDSRLVRFDLSRNRGRYFADAVVAAATDDPYYLVQDADDWSEPERLETLLRLLLRTDADAALSAQIVHTSGGRRRLQNYADFDRPIGPNLEHRGDHHGLFRTDALRRIGGYDGGFRIGYDTLLVNLLRMMGTVSYSSEPLYHRRQRPGSLTIAPATGFRSSHRAAVHRALSELYERAFTIYTEYARGARGAEAMERDIRALIATSGKEGPGTCPGDRRAVLEEEAKRLRGLLAAESTRGPRKKETTSSNGTVSMSASAEASDGQSDVSFERVPSDLPISAWTLSRESLQALGAQLSDRRPARIVEVGSGSSTVVLGRYAAAHGARVVTLEHEARYADRTDGLLRRYGVREAVDLRYAPLRPFDVEGERFSWYDIDLGSVLDGLVDFVLIDGPPLRHGREAVLSALAPHLASGWTAWLDDGFRTHEIDCLHRWAAHHSIAAEQRSFDEKGLWIVRDASGGRPDADPAQAGRVACTILTGQRPRLFRATIEALQRHTPGFLEAATVVVLVNGSDTETRAYVRTLSFVDRCLDHEGSVLSIGTATSRLMREIRTLPSEVDRVLHLEDDWHAGTFEAGWLSRSLALLDNRPDVGQVRLRDHRDSVLSRHMVTGDPIQWTALGADRVAPSAHFTFNPSLVRRTHLDALYPCADEADAQRRFLRLGLGTVQLVPGVFTHLGEGTASLRRRTASMASDG